MMGGKAFPDVESASTTEMCSAANAVVDRLGILTSRGDSAILGSVAANIRESTVSMHGDVDIGIESDGLGKFSSYQDLVDACVQEFGSENVSTQGIAMSQVFLRFDNGNKKIQVDLCLGNLQSIRFGYYSPGPRSEYKGLYRTEFVKAMAKSITSFEVYDGAQLVAKRGFTFFPERGLVSSIRWCKPRKDGSGWTKTMVELSKDDNDLFSRTINPLLASRMGANHINPQSHDTVVRDKYMMLMILLKRFGKGSVMDFESTLSSIERIADDFRAAKASPYRQNNFRQYEIAFRLYEQRLKDMKLTVPDIFK